ncbi:ABC transporter substrate-binding protein [Streptomyces sp. V3I7]|uniref:ABC transporter substrate-binding protein n=1 Tax=Streptomyces sp. V3I7 TaxID=3042278 RepID=UPI00277DC959|nr:ABC transporter substrate-binding protein [Streptomyces sp. V3I7]MDQ0989962.1 peptide/nickel transport system substrate-binding protein [Streptomyces sp. V3I7]
MNRKTLVLPAVAGLLAPVLAACGGSDSGSADDGAITVGTTDRFSATQEAPAPLDPAAAYDIGSWNILRQTVQTLMIQPKGDGDPVPEAAESCGFTDSGNERYACKLREGLMFSDGSPVTAKDVKFSIDRALRIKADSGVFALLSTVDTVETQGDREVVFHLKTADATFPYKLSTEVAGIVNPKDYANNKLRDGFQVDGSGPYTVQTDVRNNEVVSATFTKNPTYKGSVKVNNDKVVLRTFPDATAMGTALNKGDIGVMTRTMTPAQIQKLETGSNPHVDLVDMPGLEIRYLAFNTDAPTVKSKAVRQAMAQIIDRGELVSKVYGTQAEPLYSLVPASITGHSNSFFNKYGNPSPARAKALLARAGISTPVKLTLNYTTDHYGASTQQEFEVLKKQLDDSGLFDVTLNGSPWSTFRPAAQKGRYDVYGLGWFPDFPDADNYLAPFLDKDNFLHSPYTNSQVATLVPESRRQADRLSATKSLTALQDIVAEDVPVLPLWQGKQYIAARDDITGTSYAVSSISTLQLWELSRGVSG